MSPSRGSASRAPRPPGATCYTHRRRPPRGQAGRAARASRQAPSGSRRRCLRGCRRQTSVDFHPVLTQRRLNGVAASYPEPAAKARHTHFEPVALVKHLVSANCTPGASWTAPLEQAIGRSRPCRTSNPRAAAAYILVGAAAGRVPQTHDGGTPACKPRTS